MANHRGRRIAHRKLTFFPPTIPAVRADIKVLVSRVKVIVSFTAPARQYVKFRSLQFFLLFNSAMPQSNSKARTVA